MGRPKSAISMLSMQRMLKIKNYKTVWTMGHKIRKAMADRDAYYKLAGLIEMDDTYFGAPKPGKRGRGASGKAKVVVAVETPGHKPRFAALRLVPRVSGQEIQALVRERLVAEVAIKTDGWQGYSFLDGSPCRHEWLVPGSGKEEPKVLSRVHTLIANVKGNIRDVHHGLSPKHLPRYLAQFCYRLQFWEPQMFNRMLHACFNTSTVTFSELRQ
jgi:transposase-like protein